MKTKSFVFIFSKILDSHQNNPSNATAAFKQFSFAPNASLFNLGHICNLCVKGLKEYLHFIAYITIESNQKI